MRRHTSCRLRVGWPALDSAANLLGMTRTAQGSFIFAGYRITSGGVLLSFPGQNGQLSTKDGTVCGGRCVANSSGRLARSVAIMTHSMVKKFCRSSGTVVLLHLPSAKGGRDCSSAMSELKTLPQITAVVESKVSSYEQETSHRHSGSHRRCRTEVYPDAGAPSLVRSGVARRFRSF